MRRFSHIFLLTATCFSIAACEVGRDYTAPELPKLSDHVLQENTTENFSAAAPVQDWWNTLEDKQLSGLVEQALAHNHDVRIAVATMEQARATANVSDLAQLPVVTAGAYGERVRQSNADEFNYPKRNYNTYQAGFDATWELDFFGRVSEQAEADTARYEASVANLRGVYVTVAAEVARNYIELRGAQERLNVAKRNAENEQQTFDLVQQQVALGRSSEVDLDRAQSQLQKTLATVPLLDAQVSASINHLGVLTGQTPDALRAALQTPKPLPTLPCSVAVGDAGSLLKRRPDIAAAERNLAASVADYNVNVADLYPRITLNGNIGFIASSLAELATKNAFTTLVQPALSWSAFDREQVEARIDASDAVTRAQLATFEKTVLGALEETDNAMVNFSHEQQRRDQLLKSAEAQTHAYELAKKRYETGLDSFSDLLDTQRQMLDAQDQLAVSETQASVDLIALYKALGGGWEVAPTRAHTTEK